MPSSSIARSVGGALCALGCFTCLAHEGPEHEIDELTERMSVEGQTPDLLIQRAIEFRVLGKLPEAARDLERALDSPEESVTAKRELSQVYFALGKTNEALALVTRALKEPADAPEQASLLMVRSGILSARREYAKALTDTTDAIQKYPDNVEWYFVRSQLQASLKLKQDRVKGLQEGIRQTGSGLLVAEWVDALIEAGDYATALEKIESELRQSRWRAAWLTRRAKVRLATGQDQDAKKDLAAALEELNQRLGPSASDALLLADRALAYELLGRKEEARRDYRAARDKGLTEEWIRERLRALREPGKEED
jgi:tetratricopeptide (TPR) repeat protein